MAVQDRPLGATAVRVARRGGATELLEREGVFSWLMLAPALLFLLAFVAYPFCYGLYISLTDLSVGGVPRFVGLQNYLANLRDPGFWQVARNTVVYTAGATVLKLIGGLLLALVMNNQIRGKNVIRAAFLLPWIVPTVLSAIAWMWIFDPTFSVLNWFLVHSGLMVKGPSWLADSTLAMLSVIIANVWRGI